MAVAAIESVKQADQERLVLSGDWTLATLPAPISALERRLCDLAASHPGWDLLSVTRLDSAGAILLWRAWGRQWPAVLAISPGHRALLERIDAIRVDVQSALPKQSQSQPLTWLLALGQESWVTARHLLAMVALIGQMVLDLAYLCVHPRDMPWREFSANLYKTGAQALPVTALIGFLIGVVLSYLSALQLKTFGADVFIVNLLGISIVRELGPVLVAVLVAGRSGSAMTAQIGVMRVTEEIDALATMGVSRSQRLVLPKVLALAVAMPLLVIWCSAAGIIGGMVSAKLQMDLSYGFFIDTLPRVVPVANVWIGIGKGVVFGLLIALIACHFGLQVKPNTESLSSRTTTSVVTSITVAIIVDAVFAVLTRNLGIP
ncbi:MlaE family lipid ABC transporter permease subunit [Candidatus Accumulibacter vicinus]|uniref:Putative phospholipid ABC transporter permease protein MlaE n=1 Tax=Candidatus Accumulibacter vicinus TaxID=2954382 RepID=A0A084XYL4_9PROT|nr:MlaE family lipid ABC transporter permease subunit [Candidatus Accumulibacter vicinus]KFB67558.1 MAG: putative phospholipid ABC transporter permease protein MlaE [Candidatus Accumulibacter vicinus]